MEQTDARIVEALRAGDEAAFAMLVERYHAQMVRVARLFVPTQAIAEDVAQEAWLGLLNGLDRFEGRSSLKTWLFRILSNIAKTRGEREGRAIPFSSVVPDEPSADPGLFHPAGTPKAGHWVTDPATWPDPADEVLAKETTAVIAETIDMLPPNQAAVIRLRDVEGWTSAEVCNALDITETNQRVLLHRARNRVRAALERHFDEGRA